MNWLVDNWMVLIGAVTTPIAWIFGGKQAKKAELKNVNGDFLNKVQGIYDALVDDLKADRDMLKSYNLEQDKKIEELQTDFKGLQKQFNDLYLAYAKEVESSKHWKEKFEDLEKKYNELEKDHETLKKQFESYKKTNK
jgi:predicted RNase H-like nuclease (RuvC/YqgF family)